jgi:hypothetical protein
VATIAATWAPRLPGLFERGPEIIVYPDGYDPFTADAAFAYWLPLP